MDNKKKAKFTAQDWFVIGTCFIALFVIIMCGLVYNFSFESYANGYADLKSKETPEIIQYDQKLAANGSVPKVPINETANASKDKKETALQSVNLNLATEEQLCTLAGIGPSKAKTIIEYRDNNGYFENVEELLNVRGIGNATLENIKKMIYV
ncbi:MAG: helix-hairpin-helix domain-containing protein [Oscillospiraceae bacterium]